MLDMVEGGLVWMFWRLERLHSLAIWRWFSGCGDLEVGAEVHGLDPLQSLGSTCRRVPTRLRG